MKKKFSTLISVLLVFTMIITACSNGSSGPAEETIKIGWIGSLTGDQAVWGTCESNMVKMLIEEVNANGGILGKKVEGVYYDTKGDAAEAVNATKRLASQDKVVAIIGPNASGQAIAISSVLEEYKVPDIATVATNPKVTVNDDGSVKEFNFRVCFIDPYQGAVAAGYAYDRLGFTRAAVLYDVASDYSQGFTEFFEKTFTEKGGTVVAKEAFKEGDVEFKPQLSRIKDADPEVILMPYYYKEVALSANQARELTGITENYVGIYLYINKSDYESAFNENIEYNTIMVDSNIEEGQPMDEAIETLLRGEIMSAEPLSQLKKSFDSLLNNINFIVTVLVTKIG
jgi:branched-chain amino acid transport system substrate-binding protein